MSRWEVILYSVLITLLAIFAIGFFTKNWGLAIVMGSFVGISRMMKGLNGLDEFNKKGASGSRKKKQK